MHPYQVLVVGSGPGGVSVATRLAKRQLRVALIEAEEPGGNCALHGCNPKKVLVHAAELLQAAEDGKGKLIDFETLRIDWAQLARFRDTFVQPVTPKTIEGLEEAGVDIYAGKACFTGPNTMMAGDAHLKADHIVLATGAKPMDLGFEGAHLLSTNREFLQMQELPRRILFVGGGYISMEFAHIAIRCGAEVTIAERGDEVLDNFEPSIRDQLLRVSRTLGIDIRLRSAPLALSQEGRAFAVAFDQGPPQVFDLVVHGAGREPALDGLALDVGEVHFKKSGITVNEQMRSVSNAHVFAIGDCAQSGDGMLTPVANAHAHAVVQIISGENTDAIPDTLGVATAVFTVPTLASVGLTTTAAEARGLQFDVVEGDMSKWGSVRKVGAQTAAFKLLFEKSSDACLGAHLIGPRAEETINLFCLAIRAEITRAQLKAAPLAFPTFGHDLRQMI